MLMSKIIISLLTPEFWVVPTFGDYWEAHRHIFHEDGITMNMFAYFIFCKSCNSSSIITNSMYYLIYNVIIFRII